MKQLCIITCVATVVLMMGCGAESNNTRALAPAEASSTEFRPDWRFEWYHMSDLQCMAEADERPEMLLALLDLDDEAMAATLSDPSTLVAFASPFVDSFLEETRDYIPEGADVPWRSIWPEKMKFELRTRGEGIDSAETFLVSHEGIYLLWPFNIAEHRGRLRDDWSQRIASLVDSGLFELPPMIDRDPVVHSTGNLLKAIDDALEADKDYRSEFERCEREAPGRGATQRSRRRACTSPLLQEVHMADMAAGELLDIRANRGRHMVNTLLFPGEEGELIVEIGTKPVDYRGLQGKVPHWGCLGRMIQ